MIKSPCTTCPRANVDCEGPPCKVWNKWFKAYWSALRQKYLPQKEEVKHND